MHSRALAALALAFAAVAALVPMPAAAWSNGGYSADLEDPDYGTHDWIADRALDMQMQDVSFLQATYHAEYLLGTEAPDNPELIGDTSEHHVYYNASGGLEDDSSAQRASAMYGLALDELDSGDFSAAAYYIGAMTHYIADLGVFGHTMGADTDWGVEVHHSDYEDWIQSRTDALADPYLPTLGDFDAYNSTLALAHDTTFGAGDVKANVWMDANYDWSDQVFLTSAFLSLYGAVSAAAAAINHLAIEAAAYIPQPTAPSAPVSVEAHVDNGTVVLIWSPPLDDGGAPILSYDVHRGTSADDREFLDFVQSSSLTFRDAQVEAGTTYTYWVTAFNQGGTSPFSEPATATLPDDDPPLLLAAAMAAVLAVLALAGAFLRTRRSHQR